MPAEIAEGSYRSRWPLYRAHSDAVRHLFVVTAMHMKGHPAVVHFTKSVDNLNHGITSRAPRYLLYGFMAAYGNAVVSRT